MRTSFEVLQYVHAWPRIVNLFQTFADLEPVKDKQTDMRSVCQVLDEDQVEDELLC